MKEEELDTLAAEATRRTWRSNSVSENYATIKAAIDQALALSREKQGQWIPVTERLPEGSDEVLVYCPTAKYHQIDMDSWSMQREYPVGWSSKTVETGFMWDNHEFDYVTHWMPLPKPPSVHSTSVPSEQRASSKEDP